MYPFGNVNKASVVRRSPRFAQNDTSPHEDADGVSLRLLFPSTADGGESAPPNDSDPVPEITVNHRVQQHPSLELVDLPSSVDMGGSARVVRSAENFENANGAGVTSFVSNLNDHQPTASQNSPGGAILISEEEGVVDVRASQASEMTAAYNFLLRKKVKELTLSKDMNLKQLGKKDFLVARVFIHIDIRVASDKSLVQVLSGHYITARFDAWVKHQLRLDERVPQYWVRLPSLSELLDKLEEREAESFKRRKLNVRYNSDPINLTDPRTTCVSRRRATGPVVQPVDSSVMDNLNFSISEFARLYIIIRDDEDVKAALLVTAQELTRSQIDAGFNRDSFWGVIEGRYNDPILKLHLNMVGNVDDVDSTITPPCHRYASFLKDKFLDARSSFTYSVNNWSTSGQNEINNFKNFAGLQNGPLTAEGKRNMILFTCVRMGTRNEDTRFSGLCSRAIPFGWGCDEGGSVEEAAERNSVARGSGIRRNPSRNSGVDSSSLDHSIVYFTEQMIQRNALRDENRKSNEDNKDEERRERIEEIRERREQRRQAHERRRQRDAERRESKRRKQSSSNLQQLADRQQLVQPLKDMQENLISQGLDPGTKFEVAARKQQAALFQAFSMPENTPEGLQGDIELSDSDRSDVISRRQTTTQEGRNRGELACSDEDDIRPNNP